MKASTRVAVTIRNNAGKPSDDSTAADTAGPMNDRPSMKAPRFQPALAGPRCGSIARNSVWIGTVRNGNTKPSTAAPAITCHGVCSSGSNRYSNAAAITPRRNIARLPWRSIQAPIGSAISSTPR